MEPESNGVLETQHDPVEVEIIGEPRYRVTLTRGEVIGLLKVLGNLTGERTARWLGEDRGLYDALLDATGLRVSDVEYDVYLGFEEDAEEPGDDQPHKIEVRWRGRLGRHGESRFLRSDARGPGAYWIAGGDVLVYSSRGAAEARIAAENAIQNGRYTFTAVPA